MKTISLTEAYKKATPGPLRVVLEPQGVKCLDGSELVTKHWLRPANSEWSVADVYATEGCDTHPGMQGANAALLAHAFNVLPEVVGALRKVQREYISETAACHEWLDNILAKASTVEVPE